MFELLRRYSFWILDFLKGGELRKNYTDIKFINDNYFNSKVKNRRELLLQKILNHAISSTKYYNKLEINSSLDQFGVVNKNIIRGDFAEFESKSYKNKLKYKVVTSGSTGVPFVTYLNKDKKNRNSTDTIYFVKKAGFKMGEQLFYIRLWDNQHRRTKVSERILNIVSHNISDLSDVDISNILDKMKKSNYNKGLLAYASAYDVIGQYLDRIKPKPFNYKVRSIIAIAEGVSDYARKAMQKYFSISVISRYSASETGIIAQQNSDCSDFDINWASYMVEVLDVDTDNAVRYGKTGRIVITDLFNYAVPLIRYDTGDLGVMNINSESKEPVLTKIEGRKMDMIYNTNGDLISSHIVHQICLYKGIIQYQLIQTDKKEYLFKINATKEFIQEQELINRYKKYFGKDSIINIDYVDEIPILSSGKRRKVVNLYKK